MEKTGLKALDKLCGKIAATARADDYMQEGVVMMPFSFNEAAANLITNEALDPFGKIPEFKFCAVRLSPGTREDDVIQRKKARVLQH